MLLDEALQPLVGLSFGTLVEVVQYYDYIITAFLIDSSAAFPYHSFI